MNNLTLSQIRSWATALNSLKALGDSAIAIADELSDNGQASVAAQVSATIYNLDWTGKSKKSADRRADHEKASIDMVARAFSDLGDACHGAHDDFEHPVNKILSLIQHAGPQCRVRGDDASWTVTGTPTDTTAEHLHDTLLTLVQTISSADSLWAARIARANRELHDIAAKAGTSASGQLVAQTTLYHPSDLRADQGGQSVPNSGTPGAKQEADAVAAAQGGQHNVLSDASSAGGIPKGEGQLSAASELSAPAPQAGIAVPSGGSNVASSGQPYQDVDQAATNITDAVNKSVASLKAMVTMPFDALGTIADDLGKVTTLAGNADDLAEKTIGLPLDIVDKASEHIGSIMHNIDGAVHQGADIAQTVDPGLQHATADPPGQGHGGSGQQAATAPQQPQAAPPPGTSLPGSGEGQQSVVTNDGPGGSRASAFSRLSI